jgi:hypothetical protein
LDLHRAILGGYELDRNDFPTKGLSRTMRPI